MSIANESRRFHFSLRQFLWGVGVLAVWFWMLSFEWHRAPNSLLLGPLFFVWYGYGGVFVWSLTVGLSAGILSFVVWPRPATGIIAAISLLAWLFFGEMGRAIGC